jgi:exodeoxyribonuclease VII small subunit
MDPLDPLDDVDPLDLDPEQLSFEELVSALELLTDRLASGQIGIEEAADLYERAELLHGLASQRLARVQARIEALGGTGTGTGTGASVSTPANATPRSQP